MSQNDNAGEAGQELARSLRHHLQQIYALPRITPAELADVVDRLVSSFDQLARDRARLPGKPG